MGRIAGQPNKLTTEVKDKLQTVMDDLVSQLDVNSMTTDQKIKYKFLFLFEWSVAVQVYR